jgi:serine phosphatase RsbU (regulator of sigma subunit)
MLKESTAMDPSLRAHVDAADASLMLHQPGLAAADVTTLLETIVQSLGLSDVAVFVTEAMSRVDDDDGGGGDETVAVRRPDGLTEGLLRCRPVDDGARHTIGALAAHAGLALAAAARMTELERREAALRRIAEHLQDSLLPELPALPNTNIEVQYRAAGLEARVGGDFYDAFPLPNGRVLIVVGDVMGKGVEAASRTTRITQTLRALALQGRPLDEMLERCDEQVTFQDPEIMATVWCGLYDPEDGELEFASLGHPPALLLRADGEPTRLTLEGLPLGMRDLAVEPPEVRGRRLATRDLLVLYTDGVVEASGDYIAGQEALLGAIVARRHEPLSQLVQDALDELLADAGHSDDAVMFLLRRR